MCNAIKILYIYISESIATATHKRSIRLAGCNDTLISIWVVNQPHPITKCCITSTIRKHHLLRAIRKRDLLAAICIVMLNLFVREVK